MLDAIYAGESGLKANQARLNVLSNNLANVNTPAFKKARVQFSELMYRSAPEAGGGSVSGLGTRIAKISPDFQQGDLRQTDRPLDLAIQGSGFFEVQLANSSTAYTRLAALQISPEGELLTQAGDSLNSFIRIPTDALAVTVSAIGEVRALTASDRAPVLLGQLELATFANAEALDPIGQGLYQATEASGVVVYAKPGDEGAGSLKQGFLESSNVDLTEELGELLLTQRAYQVNAQLIRAADDLLAEVNNIRR